jgi:peroxiredoxin
MYHSYNPLPKEPPVLKEGQTAPLFNLPNENGSLVSLKSLKGQSVVLYFYPQDLTPGCTQEACDFRDNWARLKKKGVVVLGVSADPAKRHTAFKEKYALPFGLLSDEKKTTLKAYQGAEKLFLHPVSSHGVRANRSKTVISGRAIREQDKKKSLARDFFSILLWGLG